MNSSDKRAIVIVLDGFGIGAMDDAASTRPGNELSNTLKSILEDYPNLCLPNLQRLGLMNAYGQESAKMQFSKEAIFGKSKLKHFGADTFMGHQEIMGTTPKEPIAQPFQLKLEEIKACLIENGHNVEKISNNHLSYLLVDHYCTVADNIDADLGMAYNCTVCLDKMSFDNALVIAKLVRKVATVNRVIVFGGAQTTMKDIISAEETRGGKYIGIHAVKSKSYQSRYQCLHLGYGVDKKTQVPTILTKNNIPVTLIGKVADIVNNDMGKSISCVKTSECFTLTKDALKKMKYGFICTNIQETDLAGHSQDSQWYKDLLLESDYQIGCIVECLRENDILIVMADHGNDPNIGNNMHTRENVPILIYKKGRTGKNIGYRNTLSDVGATITEYFGVESPESGTSFLSQI